RFPGSALVSSAGFGVSPKQSLKVRDDETSSPTLETSALPGILLDPLAAGDDLNQLNPVAVRKRALRPLAPMQRDAVMLDQQRGRRQLQNLHEIGHGGGSARIGRLAVEGNCHSDICPPRL